MSHFHAVVWLDHREARVFHLNADEVEKSVIHPDEPVRHLHHKAGTIGAGHAKERQAYYHEVAEALSDAGEILVVGPANAKLELIKHIHAHHPAMVDRVVGVETVDHPSDGQLVAYARKAFERIDHMTAQTGPSGQTG